MIPEKSLVSWFTLKSVNGVGNIIFKKLIEVFETPEKTMSASPEELCSIPGISENLARRITGAKPDQSAVMNEIELAEKSGFTIITFNHSHYPLLLKEIADPPPYIYVYGSLIPETPRIAIVGSRNATFYGTETADRLARELAGFGIETVSGMARGIDTSAHEGALKGMGRTIAILGSGLKKIYPPENNRLFHKIAENGAVISEFPLHEGPEARNFPRRNRIISGISNGVVIVEAGSRSGSLITAGLAADQGREVFAVPGSINSSRSTGTHGLLKQGARLIERAEDIIEELPYLLSPAGSAVNQKQKNRQQESGSLIHLLDESEKKILAGLDAYPVHIDEIGRKCGLEPGKVSCILLELELKGLVNQHPGKLYALKEEKNWANR